MSYSASSSADLSESLERQSSQSSLSGETGFPPKVLDNAARQQPSNVEYDSGWNTYLDWDLPDLVYQNNSSAAVPDPQTAWYTDGFANNDQTTSGAGSWPCMLDTSGQLSYSMTQPTSITDFSGLPAIAPTANQAFPAEYPCNTYDPIFFDKAGLIVNEPNDPNPCLPKASPSEQSENKISQWKSPEAQPIALTNEIEATPNIFAAAPNPSKSLASSDVKKKRKLAHSIIEKNYRSRINTGLAELRQCVPTTQTNDPRGDSSRVNGLQGAEDANINQSSGKVATITDAVQYVKTLELQNRSLYEKLDLVQRRHDLLQKIALSKLSPNTAASDATIHALAQEDIQPLPEAFSDLKSRKRRKESPPARARPGQSSSLAVLHPDRLQRSSRSRLKSASSLASLRKKYGNVTKLAIGTLATIAMLEGMTEDETNGKMLFALPTELATQMWQFITFRIQNISFGIYSHGFVTFLKIFLIITILFGTFSPFFWIQTELLSHQSQKLSSAASTAFLPIASPLDERRNAWLTSIQSVSVPSRYLGMELGALIFKLGKVCLRKILGWQSYAWLTGACEDDEKARIKAWDIAIDAQLAGGDPEVCWNRLLLTFLASTTLPDTPSRLMLKALHIQVINAFLRHKKYIRWMGSDRLASGISEYYWNKAKILHNNGRLKSVDTVIDVSSDPFPPCYAELLAQPSCQVFNVAIAMRAYCLALNEPLDQLDIVADEGIDTVVDDIEIRAPVEALAAWWSSLCLRRSLIAVLNATEISYSSTSAIYQDILLALKTAPKGSVAEMRALASRAIFCMGDRRELIAAALDVLPIASSQTKIDTLQHKHLFLGLIQPSIESVCTTSVRISLRSAILLERTSHGPIDHATVALLVSLGVALDQDDVSLLGFVAAYQCLHECAQNRALMKAIPGEIRRLAARLRALMGNTWSNWSEGHGVPDETIEKCVKTCAMLSKERDDMRPQ